MSTAAKTTRRGPTAKQAGVGLGLTGAIAAPLWLELLDDQIAETVKKLGEGGLVVAVAVLLIHVMRISAVVTAEGSRQDEQDQRLDGHDARLDEHSGQIRIIRAHTEPGLPLPPPRRRPQRGKRKRGR